MRTMNELIRRFRREESGLAMIMVIGFMLTMAIIVAAATAYAINVVPQTQHGLSSTRALAAAQAGIDHYLGHLNQDRNYWETTDCSNPALQGPNPDPGLVVNNCNYGASTPIGWVAMSTSDVSNGQFHYDVDTSDMDQFTIWLSSTGRADGVERTLQAKVSIAGSQRYLYVTDFEDADPENQVAYSTGTANGRVDCGANGVTQAKYWWSGAPNNRSANSGYCSEIQFITNDILDGPVHFNDMPLVNGNTQFKQGFTTYSPNCPKVPVTTRTAAVNKCFRGSGSPVLGTKGARWANFNALPDTTGDLVNKPGCQYIGDTRIRFWVDGSGKGKMDVWNTMSVGKTLGTTGAPAVIETAPNCGVAGNFKAATGQKYPGGKQTVDVPDGMVIFVKGSGTSAPCVPGQVVNGTTSGSTAGDQIPLGTGTTNGGVTDISYSNPTWRRTKSGSTWPSTASVYSNAYPTKNDCGLGNVYVEGTMAGRVTIAAENNVYLTGNLLLSGVNAGDAPTRENRNIIGLVAQNSVVVYHPVQVSGWTSTKNPTNGSFTCPSTPSSTSSISGGSSGNYCQWAPNTYSNLFYPNVTTTTSNRWVYASIQTLAHSFWVGSYNQGSPTGYLSVRGSIAQRWRGIVGTGSISTGYIKDYKYDQRLQTTSPPYFPPWANGEWAAETTGEIPPDGG